MTEMLKNYYIITIITVILIKPKIIQIGFNNAIKKNRAIKLLAVHSITVMIASSQNKKRAR